MQVKVLPVTDRAAEYADQVARSLDGQGFRVEVDHRNEKIGKKIREAQLEKVPYMLVVGDRDMENGTVSPVTAPTATWAPCPWRTLLPCSRTW